MLKTSCRQSHFLTEWSFRAKVFPRQVPKTSCHIICTVQDFSNKNYFVFIVNENKRTSPTTEKKLEGSAETLGGVAETDENSKLNSSCEAE